MTCETLRNEFTPSFSAMRITTIRRPDIALPKSMTPGLTTNAHALITMFLSTYGRVQLQLRLLLETVQG